LQPTVYTRYAKIHFRRGLNSGPLNQFLIEVAAEIGAQRKMVLFPTSDRISKAIARSWDELSGRYLLTWAHCRELVLQLQRKDSLAAYCARADIAHPKSVVVATAAECRSAASGLRYPLVVKPAQPLSAFKALRVSSLGELERIAADYAADLPFVVQEWIDGPEPSLYSCTTYLDHGRPLHLFTSRKLAASPPGLGQGTVFETVDEEEPRELASRFLGQLDLSGPAAVEFKRDAAGKFWLIEPNVGRTEYCVDLAIQSGFDLPYVEYLHATHGAVVDALPTSTGNAVWFDTDKDAGCFLANIAALRGDDGSWRKPVFPFLGHRDWTPLAASYVQLLTGSVAGVARRVSRALRPVKA